jgi:hypothetical protein
MDLLKKRKLIFVLLALAAILVLGAGQAWAGSYKKASKRNKQECKEWCATNPNCRKCTNFTTCGLGVKTLKRFGGAGENWYACQK